MRLSLGHSVQIKARLDFVQATLQPFGVGSVDATELIEPDRGMRRARVALIRCRGSRLS